MSTRDDVGRGLEQSGCSGMGVVGTTGLGGVPAFGCLSTGVSRRLASEPLQPVTPETGNSSLIGQCLHEL